MTSNNGRLGMMFTRERPPEELVAFCRQLDGSAVDDLWLVEDLEWAGSIASAATALAATTRLRIGIGIAPAPLRNPALLAMELATLSRMYPNRLAAGIGHGVPEWMQRVGARVSSPLALLEETVIAVRSLLHGETVTMRGRAVHLDPARLVHPPAIPPPILTGVVKPRSLELSGRVADGTILVETTGPQRLTEARTHIEAGRTSAESTDAHEIVVLTHLYVDDDPTQVRSAIQRVSDEYATILGAEPSDLFIPAGSPPVVADRIRALWDAGADTVVAHPLGTNPTAQIRHLLAALGR